MKYTKRVFTLMLALVLLVSAVATTAFAASWPGLSSTKYCEMVSSSQIPVYRNTGLSTRGTSSPAKSYNAYVSAGDKVYIYKITGSYTQLSYPTSSGRKIGYVSTSALLSTTAPSQVVTSKAKVTTYQYASSSSSYGYVAVNDTVYKLGTRNGYVLVIYNAASGSRGYKAGYVTTADYNRIVGTTSSTGTQNMSYALYKTSGGRISCGFNGYVSTPGKHEGIDFVRGIDSKVYSLTDGVITRVTQGARGSSGLSTIAIYSAATGKTVIYLHTNPLDSLYVGQSISRGQQIAIEDWRGVSSSNSAHTHVEVRNGRHTGAAKSVNDYTLDNPNPTAFWNSQGYAVK